jgi:hypothetical protein
LEVRTAGNLKVNPTLLMEVVFSCEAMMSLYSNTLSFILEDLATLFTLVFSVQFPLAEFCVFAVRWELNL